MANPQLFAPFNPTTESWEAYVARFDCFLIANDYRDLTSERKRAYFLSFCGPEMFDTAMTLMAPQSIHAGTWDEFMNKLKRHYTPAPSRIARRQHFYHRDQAEGESISQYVAALRKAARHCQFVDLDDYLLDRLVSGVRDQNLKRRLIAKPELSFQEALDEACAAELATLSLADLPRGQSGSQPKGESVHCSSAEYDDEDDLDADGGINQIQDARRPARLNPQPNSKCRGCGGLHPRSACRFREAVCRRCGRRGHIARVCQSPQAWTAEAAPPKGDRWDLARNPKTQYDRPFRSRDASAVNMVSAAAHVPLRQKIFISVAIEGKPCQMEEDSGSATSLASWSTVKRLVPRLAKNRLTPCDVHLRDYQGRSIPVVGCGHFRVRFKNFSGKLPLVIVEAPLPSLVGLNWFEALGLTIHGVNAIHSDELDSLVTEFPSVFDGKLGCYKGTPVSFTLDPQCPPRRLKPRRVPFALKAKVDAELDKLLAQGVLEPVDFARWETPIVTPIKADGSLRICADYRVTINKALLGHSYPVPVVQHVLHSLGKGAVFAKLDLSQAYQQLLVDDETAEAQTIVTHRGTFRCRRLQFGISVAPGLFQSLMERVLHGIPGVVPYFDDVLVSAANTSELMDRLRCVLHQFDSVGLKVNRAKCQIAVPQVEFLGFLVDSAGIHPTPAKTAAIVDAPPPRCRADLQAFLGLLNFYVMFLPHKASVAEPLHRLLDRGVSWVWGPTEAAAFAAVKRLLVSNSVLTHYSDHLPLVLACDGSPFGVSAVLSHRLPSGREIPVAYFSRTLGPAERNYSQLDREALALVAGVRRFHHYLYGRSFLLVTDHKPLLGILASDRQAPLILSPRMTRYSVFLSAYSYTLIHRPGHDLAHADALSRCPLPTLLADPVPVSTVCLIDSSPLPVTVLDIARLSAKDAVLSRVLDWMARGWPPGPYPKDLQPFATRQLELSTQSGCLLWGHRVVVPPALRRPLLSQLHQGHPGIVRMKALGQCYMWWPNLDKDISEWVSQCPQCQDSRPMPPREPPREWEEPRAPWSRVHIDLAGPCQGQSFLIVVDSFSKWVEVVLMHSTTADAVIRALRRIFSTHGLPDILVSDNGPQFTATPFETFLAAQGIRHCLIAPFHPASNGCAERAVRSAKEALQRLGPGSWQERVDNYLFAQHTTPCQLTNKTPAELLMGRRLRTALDRIHPQHYPSKPIDSVSRRPPFRLQDPVYVRNYGGQPLWLPGIIAGIAGPRSYRVDMGQGREWRRHQDQLRLRCWNPGQALDDPR